MGGNALKEFDARRLPAAQALQIGSKIISILQSGYSKNPGVEKIRIIQSYTDKQDFGDIDILVPNTLKSQGTSILQWLNFSFGTPEGIPYFHNNDLLSVGYPLKEGCFQVDLIFMSLDHFEFASSYFDFNDLGNLIGRIAHKMGLKFGHEGLLLPIRKGDHYIRELVLTKDFDEAIEFLGFDVSRYHQGFETLEDIFKYVTSSTYFNRDLYPLEHCNHKQRIRDRKRKTYMEFIRWLDNSPQIKSKIEFPQDKTAWLPLIFSKYPLVKEQYYNTLERVKKKEEASLKFNGQLVMEWTGLSDKELGRIMRSFKAQFLTHDDYLNFILCKTLDELKTEVLNVLTLITGNVQDQEYVKLRQEFRYMTSHYNSDQQVADLINKHTMLKIDSWTVSNLKHPDCISKNLKPVVLAFKRVHSIERGD
jgi:hypothetical protein